MQVRYEYKVLGKGGTQVIVALRRRADALEADAKVFRTDHEVALSYAPTVGDAAVASPALLRFFASQFRALADEAEGRGALEPDRRAGDAS